MNQFMESLGLLEPFDLIYVLAGLAVLGLSVLLSRFRDHPFSFPIVALSLGYVAFSLPLGLPEFDVQANGKFVLHLTELGVILSLMGVGLKIARLPDVHTWRTTWRLLGIGMPLTIAGVAILAVVLLDVPPAAALLLGAALAPTDPVLASDVQVGAPMEPRSNRIRGNEETDDPEHDPAEKEDELRFTLTSEAGLNDALAFPFTYLALLVLTEGLSPAAWWSDWLLIDVIYRIAVGTVLGAGLGWLLSRSLLGLSVDSEQDKMKVGVGGLASTLLLYGATEALGGYGFLAVFVGGLTIRHIEVTNESHRSLHIFIEQSEQLFMTIILVALGAAIADGLLDALTWEAALAGLLLIFLIRPLAGLISLIGEGRLSWLDRGIVSFFGIRGIGCLFYLTYALQKGSFADADLLWATCAFTVVVSIWVHGISAAPAIRYHDRRRDRGMRE